jgi:hypothetical protein
MKLSGKIFFAFILCSGLFANDVLSQASKIPMDPTGKTVLYTEIMEIEGATKSELYTKAEAWFKVQYVNPTEVMKEKKPEEGFIKGQHRFKIGVNDEKGVRFEAGFVQYTITVTCKDGKYKYEVFKINWKQQSYFGMERWLNTTAPDYKPVWEEYVKQSDEHIKGVIASLKKMMGGGKITTTW